MKKTVSTIVVLMAVTTVVCLLSGCVIKVRTSDSESDLEKVKEEKETEPFTDIRLEAACNVTFEQSESTSIVVEGTEEDVQALEIDNQDGLLTIDMKRRSLIDLKKHDLRVYLRSPKIENVQLHGAGNFEINGPVETELFAISLDGAGNLDTGSIKSNSIRVSLHGAGNISMKGLTAPDITLSTNGVGNMDIRFNDAGHVTCEANGVGNITLKGNVEALEKSVNGVGNVDTSGVHVKGNQ